MRNRIFPILLIVILQLLPGAVFGQDTAIAIFKQIPVAAVDSTSVGKEVKREIPNLQNENSRLQLLYIRKSPVATYFTFTQTYRGTPIYGAEIKVAVRQGFNSPEISSILQITENVKDWPYYLNQNKRVVNGITTFAKQYPGWKIQSTEPVILVDEEGYPHYAEKITGYAENKAVEVVVTQAGVVQEIDLRRFFALPDTVAQGLVFNPDPLTTAEQPYGGLYTDQNDADVPVLNAERVWKSFPATYENGLFHLRNDVVNLVDLHLPIAPPATSVDGIFNFTRAQTGFEDVMVIYHISSFNQYIRGLGYDELASFQLTVDPHGTTDDNSYFTNTPSVRLVFGIGGVDDAEDADVIIHEYTHALSYQAAPGTVAGYDRSAMEEGTADYFAASYSRELSEFRWEDVYTWDGHNEFWSGRNVDIQGEYPSALGPNKYAAGAFWASVLMEVWEELGRAYTDQLVLESLYGMIDNITMPQAAQLIIQADQAYSGGLNFEVLYNIFLNRNLIEIKETTIANTAGFLQSGQTLAIFLSSDVDNATLEIYDLQGRRIYQDRIAEKLLYLPRSIFKASGMYIVRITSLDTEVTGKVVFVGD